MNVYTDLEVGKDYLYKSNIEETRFTVLSVMPNDCVVIKMANGEESFLVSADNNFIFV